MCTGVESVAVTKQEPDEASGCFLVVAQATSSNTVQSKSAMRDASPASPSSSWSGPVVPQVVLGLNQRLLSPDRTYSHTRRCRNTPPKPSSAVKIKSRTIKPHQPISNCHLKAGGGGDGWGPCSLTCTAAAKSIIIQFHCYFQHEINAAV